MYSYCYTSNTSVGCPSRVVYLIASLMEEERGIGRGREVGRERESEYLTPQHTFRIV